MFFDRLVNDGLCDLSPQIISELATDVMHHGPRNLNKIMSPFLVFDRRSIYFYLLDIKQIESKGKWLWWSRKYFKILCKSWIRLNE